MKETYLEIGLKLLGVYAAILGAVALAGALAGLLGPMPSQLNATQAGLFFWGKLLSFVRPVTYLAIAFVLTRKTMGCVRWCLSAELPSSV